MPKNRKPSSNKKNKTVKPAENDEKSINNGDNDNNKDEKSMKTTTNYIDLLLPDEVLALVVDLLPLVDRVHRLRLVSRRWKEVTELACRTSVHRLSLLGRSASCTDSQGTKRVISSHGHLISTHLESYGFEDSEHCGHQTLYRTKYAQHELRLTSDQALQRRTSCAAVLRLFPSIRSLSLVMVCLVEQADELAHLIRHWSRTLTELTILSQFMWDTSRTAEGDQHYHPLYRFVSTLVTEAVLPKLTHLTLDSTHHAVRGRFGGRGLPRAIEAFHHFRNLPKRLRTVNLIGNDTKLFEELLLSSLSSNKTNTAMLSNLRSLSLPSMVFQTKLDAVLDRLSVKVFPQLAELTCHLTNVMSNHESHPFRRLLGLIDAHCTPHRLTSLRMNKVQKPLFEITQALPRLAPGLLRLRLDYDADHHPWCYALNDPQDVDLARVGGPYSPIITFPRLELFHLNLNNSRNRKPSPNSKLSVRRIFPALKTELLESRASSDYFKQFLRTDEYKYLYEDPFSDDTEIDQVHSGTLRIEWRKAFVDFIVKDDDGYDHDQGDDQGASDLKQKQRRNDNFQRVKNQVGMVSVTRVQDSFRPQDLCHVRLRVLDLFSQHLSTVIMIRPDL